MPHEGYANPITNDGPRFHLNMPVSELAERVNRAAEPMSDWRVGWRLSILVLFPRAVDYHSGCSPVFVPPATCAVD